MGWSFGNRAEGTLDPGRSYQTPRKKPVRLQHSIMPPRLFLTLFWLSQFHVVRLADLRLVKESSSSALSPVWRWVDSYVLAHQAWRDSLKAARAGVDSAIFVLVPSSSG